MVYTRRRYLNEPNPALIVRERKSTFSLGHRWQAIERIKMWDDFVALQEKFSDRLEKEIQRDSLTTLSEESGFNSIYDEPGLAQLHGTAIVMPVSKALPDDTFVRPGGEISVENPELRPDWGATTKRGSSRWPILCGDTKLGWDAIAAVELIGNSKHGYEHSERRDLALPLEQLQHYCLGFDVPFGFIITESYIVCCHFILSSDPKRSPRPKRTKDVPHHTRMQSTSTVSTGLESGFSDMSFEPSLTDRQVGLVQVMIEAWEGGDISLKLSLWLLAMEARNHRGMKTDKHPGSGGNKSSQGQNIGRESGRTRR